MVGDIITIRAGWHVPADARLISVRALRVQEAVLTGEAADTGKSVGHVPGRTTISGRHNMVYAGTTVVAGSAVAVVTAIGTQTEFGKIANVIRTQPSPDSPLRRNLQTAGIAIGLSALLVVVALALLQLASGVSLQETFRLAITLVVSAIPEDLTMILTIALTVGVMRMARQGGVVKQLSAAEALGEATIIAIDKTGTITQGEMKAKEFHFLQGETLEPGSIKKGDLMQEMLLTGMLLANEATVNVAAHDGTGARYAGSATERCALEFAECFGYSQKSIKKQWSISHGIHFSSAWKYRAVLAAHPTQHSQTLFVLGAPEVLLAASVMCLDEGREIVHISAARRAEIVKKLDALA
ncbi:MAG TPA: HAD-IC family P-type ATPase, partial [Methylophilaceae bacterium]|nr:HAD-IC family P-type ATPase [Methylophilaceae bacterium]